MNLILYYFLGAAIVTNIIFIWKLTNISVYIHNFFFKNKDIFTVDDLEDHLAMNWGAWGELLICPLCLSTHLSWITSLIMCELCGITYFFILSAALSWPFICYFFYKITGNK